MGESSWTRSAAQAGTARDQFGHWVAPPSMRGRPCPHSCCQGKRRHPAGMPVKLDRAYLRSLSPVELEQELVSYQRYSDTHERGFLQVLAEAQRREDAEKRKEQARSRRQQRADEYGDEVYRQWLRAENGIQGGVMLNKKGIRAGVNERSLFSGRQRDVDMYASDELKEWFQAHPRMTRRQFDAGKRAERREDRGQRHDERANRRWGNAA